MKNGKLYLRCPVVVEGTYDKARLSNVVASPILVLNGFGVFHDEQKKALLRRVSRETGLILLADSDRAGAFLRSRLKGILAGGRVYQVYAPQQPGKEKRKEKPSADGLLGVEGIDSQTLYRLLLPYAVDAAQPVAGGITRAMWFADGFSGGAHAAERRRKLAALLQLPDNLSSGALLEAVNLVCSAETYEKVKEQI